MLSCFQFSEGLGLPLNLILINVGVFSHKASSGMACCRTDVTHRLIDSSSACVEPELGHIPFDYMVEFWGRGHSGGDRW